MKAKINVDLEVGAKPSAPGGDSAKSRRVDVGRIAKKGARRRTKAEQRVEPSYMVDPGVRMLVKSAGGKSWIMDGFAHLFPEPDTIGVMHEPFVGGGAVGARYVGRCPVRLNDKNRKLMAVYQAVRDEPERLVEALSKLVYDKGDYYRAREAFNASWEGADVVTRAAWYVYLNRTGFNGLYRENQDGGFNVPFGKYTKPLICDGASIRTWSERLRRSEALLAAKHPGSSSLTSEDFEPALARVERGDFVFIDEPYLPAGEEATKKTSKFTEYQAGGFSMADQERLASLLPGLHARGARFLLTNAKSAIGFYGGWHVLEVQVARAINSKGKKRGKVPEIVVSNYPLSAAVGTAAEVVGRATSDVGEA